MDKPKFEPPLEEKLRNTIWSQYSDVSDMSRACGQLLHRFVQSSHLVLGPSPEPEVDELAFDVESISEYFQYLKENEKSPLTERSVYKLDQLVGCCMDLVYQTCSYTGRLYEKEVKKRKAQEKTKNGK